jgi:hypothetical protein
VRGWWVTTAVVLAIGCGFTPEPSKMDDVAGGPADGGAAGRSDASPGAADAQAPPPPADAGAAADAGVGEPPCQQPQPLVECARGSTHATCAEPGVDAPQPWCTPDEGTAPPTCLWFDSCPAAGFEVPCAVVDDAAECPIGPLGERWGAAPWDAERAMTLTVEQGPAPDVAPTLDCAGCRGDGADAPCFPDVLCDVDRPEALARRPAEDDAAWGPDGLLRLAFDAEGAARLLVLEVDLDAGTARGCLVPRGAEAPADAEPVCATEGTVRLTDLTLDAQGDADLVFPAFERFEDGVEVEGLTIQVAF